MNDKKLEINQELDQHKSDQAIGRPCFYRVILLNDDYTPMDFVIQVLKVFFAMSSELATQTMLQVHKMGQAVCGVYTREIAETKIAQVRLCALQNEYPLLGILEKI